MKFKKGTVLGFILLVLAVLAVCSCIMAFGARRREPEKAKLVMTGCETTGVGLVYRS
ncbi:MAG TPA: hypothetical protein VFF83_00575 [Clostridia bacterium]|nr:hypothetical protein [Bacillota bacterium]HZX45749.1 hypothetical protein [Clostridia bacterium]